MKKQSFYRLYDAERKGLIRSFRALTQAQWDAPTLDKGWQARDLAAHIISRKQRFFLRVIRYGGNAPKAVDSGVAQYRDKSPAQILHALEYALRYHWYDRLGARLLLVEVWVHHEDLTWALDIGSAQDPQVLRFIIHSFRRRYRGFRFVANDPDIQAGPSDGQVVEGPAEAIALCLAGRPAGLEKLHGPGLARLREDLKSL